MTKPALALNLEDLIKDDDEPFMDVAPEGERGALPGETGQLAKVGDTKAPAEKPNAEKTKEQADDVKQMKALFGQIIDTHREPFTQGTADRISLNFLGLMGRNVGSDTAELMLVSQMLACHEAMMGCYRRASIDNQPAHFRAQNFNLAIKLQRAWALHLETLERYRLKGKTQQTVRVERVTVNAGGQAIVGQVQTGQSPKKIEE